MMLQNSHSIELLLGSFYMYSNNNKHHNNITTTEHLNIKINETFFL